MLTITRDDFIESLKRDECLIKYLFNEYDVAGNLSNYISDSDKFFSYIVDHEDFKKCLLLRKEALLNGKSNCNEELGWLVKITKSYSKFEFIKFSLEKARNKN